MSSRRLKPLIDIDEIAALARKAIEEWEARLTVHCCYRCKATPHVDPEDMTAIVDIDHRLIGFTIRGHKVHDKSWGQLSWDEVSEKLDRQGNKSTVKHREQLCPDCVKMARFEAGEPDE